jgi:hypothetical protein
MKTEKSQSRATVQVWSKVSGNDAQEASSYRGFKIGSAQSRKVRKAFFNGFLCELGGFARQFVAEFTFKPILHNNLLSFSEIINHPPTDPTS